MTPHFIMRAVPIRALLLLLLLALRAVAVEGPAPAAEPVRLPPHPIDTIGANAYLRWKEWQARAE